MDQYLSEAQLEALVGPRTREVVQAFIDGGPMTVPGVQKVLRMASKTLYYQVAKLVDVGLLISNGGDPAIYAPIAANLRMPAGYQGERYKKLAAKSVGAGLRRATRHFAQVADRAPGDPSLVDDLLYLTANLRLTPERRAAFHAELRRLFVEYAQGEGRLVSVVFVQTPRVEN